MTNHWRDIRHADVIIINGANPAEAHPVGFQWFMKAKLDPKRGIGAGGGAKMIHIDPRFTRTSAVCDIHARLRTGTDAAFFGGLINYVLEKNLIHHEYVRHYTNASFLIKEGYDFNEGLFSGYDPAKRMYDTSTWAYEGDAGGQAAYDRTQKEVLAHGQGPKIGAGTAGTVIAKRDMQLEHPRSVFQLMRKHYSRYTPDMVASITGVPADQFLEIAKIVGETGRPDKVMTVVYAVGLTHHTTGGQMIRSAALLQLLLGNMGRPGGGMNAERGHANIQGNTDNAISWEILPGYLRIPAPGQKNLDDYVAQSAPKTFDTNSWNFFGINYRKFMVSLLKAWYGDAAKPENEFAFDYIPKPASNSSWISIFDQALKGKMEGLILSGMTATSIGPDANQVHAGAGQPQVAGGHGSAADHQLGVLAAPGHRPEVDPDRGLHAPGHALDREGRLVHQQRPLGAVEGPGAPARRGRPGTTTGSWPSCSSACKKLYQQQGGKFPDPLMALTMPYKDPLKPELDEIAQEINGYDLTTGKRLDTFAALKDDGTTTAGNWIYTGSYPEAGNLTKRRDGVQDPAKNDPTGMGYYHGWAWSWPAQPARALQPRLGRSRRAPVGPDAARHPVGRGAEAVDRRRARLPGRRRPGAARRAWLPFIMTGEGVGPALLSNSVADGPFPEHYEPIESPIENPLHPKQSGHAGGVPLRQAGGPAQPLRHRQDYPVHRDELPPDRARALRHPARRRTWSSCSPRPFVEIPEELAAREGHQDRRPGPRLLQAGQARGRARS